ncbi:KpsF/GutQ family sugar-phosphate isomerase [Pirellulaceae bacterium SH449]
MGLPIRRGEDVSSNRQKRLDRGVEILYQSLNAIRHLAETLDEDFLLAVEKIRSLKGSLIVTGIGKAGLVGRKLSATFASTGTRSHFLHPAEAVHGDLGCLGPNDLLLVLSNSGTTEEIVRLLPYLSRRSAGIIAMTSKCNSPLARASDLTLLLPPVREACQHNLAPSTSTTAMLALGDALALVVSEARGFTKETFAEFHPGGALGRSLATVDDVMRPLSECRVASSLNSIRNIFIDVAKSGRRTGAVMLVDDAGHLEGIFTDSDLARLMEQRRDGDLDKPIRDLMTKAFTAIHSKASLADATAIMAHRKISELPVVDEDDHPVGLIDVTDVLEIQQDQPNSPSSIYHHLAHDPSPTEVADDDWPEAPLTLRLFGVNESSTD